MLFIGMGTLCSHPVLTFNGDSDMKLNVLTTLKNINGDDLIEPNEKGEARKITLRMVFVNALMAPEQKDTGDQKLEKYILATDIQKNDEVEVSPEQIVLLKAAVAKPYGPVVVGPVFQILNNS